MCFQGFLILYWIVRLFKFKVTFPTLMSVWNHCSFLTRCHHCVFYLAVHHTRIFKAQLVVVTLLKSLVSLPKWLHPFTVLSTRITDTSSLLIILNSVQLFVFCKLLYYFWCHCILFCEQSGVDISNCLCPLDEWWESVMLKPRGEPVTDLCPRIPGIHLSICRTASI